MMTVDPTVLPAAAVDAANGGQNEMAAEILLVSNWWSLEEGAFSRPRSLQVEQTVRLR